MFVTEPSADDAAFRQTFICGEAVQLHGGIGFTWEAGLHAFFKRARMDEILGRAARVRGRVSWNSTVSALKQFGTVEGNPDA
jgi:alkylation response protein AidB-like acyl-CoA dehydrogenase